MTKQVHHVLAGRRGRATRLTAEEEMTEFLQKQELSRGMHSAFRWRVRQPLGSPMARPDAMSQAFRTQELL